MKEDTARQRSGLTCCRAAAMLIAFLLGSPAMAASITWDGGGTDGNWSTVANWSDDADPGGDDLVFNKTAATNVVGAVNSIVDQDVAISSLWFTNSGTSYHTVQIDAGRALSVTGSGTNLFVGGVNVATRVNMTGPGGLTINNAAATVYVRCAPNTLVGATLDLSGLGSFSATVSNLRLAYVESWQTRGDMHLATNNTIVANELSVGGRYEDAQALATLQMGLSNTIHVGSLYVARGRSTTATMKFRDGGTNCSATIRGAAGGSSRATLRIGHTAWNSTAANGTLDFGAGTVDALFGAVLMGVGCSGNGTARGYGTLNFSAGTVDATTIELGRQESGGGGLLLYGPGSGTINVGGGTLRVVQVIMGNQTTGVVVTNSGIINLSGGGVLQAVTVTNGAGLYATRQIGLNGGTIQNYPGSNMTIAAKITTVLSNALAHTFDVPTNLLMTVDGVISSANGGPWTGITKTGPGTLVLNGTNTYVGASAVSNGTTVVNGELNSGQITVAGAGTWLQGTGTIRFQTNEWITVQSGATMDARTLKFDMSAQEMGRNLVPLVDHGQGSLLTASPLYTMLSPASFAAGWRLYDYGGLLQAGPHLRGTVVMVL